MVQQRSRGSLPARRQGLHMHVRCLLLVGLYFSLTPFYAVQSVGPGLLWTTRTISAGNGIISDDSAPSKNQSPTGIRPRLPANNVATVSDIKAEISKPLAVISARSAIPWTYAARIRRSPSSTSEAAATSTLDFRGGGSKSAASAPSQISALQNFCQTIRESRRHLAAAAAARSASILTMYPVDTIKTRLHMGQSIPRNAGALYKGVGGSLLGQVPYGVLTFGSYEMYKQALLKRFEPAGVKPIFLYAAAAIMGDVTGSGWLCPSEVVKQQMQGGMYSTTSEAVRSIWKKSGFGGFYQGYFGGLARDVPFRVAQLTSYEITKKIYLKRKNNGSNANEALELSPADAAICGAIAGSFSAAITAPLDRIKTLLMTESEKYGGSVLACAGKIVADEGALGLFKGLAPRVIYIAPSVVIFFTVYEHFQQRLK
jgi:solute carrier family 25 S-adenosylmethionine transporter 26